MIRLLVFENRDVFELPHSKRNLKVILMIPMATAIYHRLLWRTPSAGVGVRHKIILIYAVFSSLYTSPGRLTIVRLPHQKSTPNSIDASYKKVLQIILIII
jgi:hypothetical protein